MAQQCAGFKKTGVQCSTIVFGDQRRCGVHRKTLEKVGPNQIRRDELKYIHQRELALLFPIFHGNDQERAMQNNANYRAAVRQENIRYQTALHELENTITQEIIENGGIDADIAVRNHNNAVRQERWEREFAVRQERRERHNAVHEARQAVAQNMVQPVVNDLARLANDRQNVHTELVVNKVKETINKILLIHVPAEYQTDTLKTSGEIILDCKLSRVAAWQMMSKYCGDENIYELGHGIYARVLNAVWQFIKSSPDSDDLKKILAAEMQDNVGMCAQGNLSRLCNILSGYMEGIEMDVKSKNEIIGERFAALIEANLEINHRLAEANAILQELDVPHGERAVWLEPLHDYD